MPDQLVRRLRSLPRRSLGEMWWRARVGGWQWLESRGRGLAGVGDREVLQEIGLRDSSANGSGGVLQFFRRRWKRPWLAAVGDGRPDSSALSIPPAEQAALCRIADDACDGRFRLLGYPSLDFGRPVDWHLDPVHQRRAPLAHWSRIAYLDAGQVGDHKIVWELNRHQFLVTLGQAYAITGDERYARAAVSYLNEWITANPPCRGINWCSSLEVGLRAISWLWCLRHVVHSQALTEAASARILATVARHGLHVERYLSTYFSPNTHLTGEALALLYLGTLLPPDTRAAGRWRQTGTAILESQLRHQVWDDGVYFEKSTWYQRYTVDIYLHATVLRRLAGDEPPAWWLDRVSLATQVLAAITRPDGTIPLIGDDDGGSLLNLEARSVGDVRPTLAVAAEVLQQPALAPGLAECSPAVSWMLGPGKDSPGQRGGPGSRVTAFRDGGWFVFRDSHASQLLVDAGPPGAYGHSHDNAIAFDLSFGADPVITDPGTFSYAGAARDDFRTGAVHSTITLDQQGPGVADGPFAWKSRPLVRVEEWTIAEGAACLRARQDGWRDSPGGPATHERTIVWLMDGCWVVCDRVRDPGQRSPGLALQAGVGVAVEMPAGNEANFQTPGGDRLTLSVTGSRSPQLTVEPGMVSRCYGVSSAAPRLRVQLPPGISAQRDDIVLSLAFARSPGAIVRHEWLPGEGAVAVVFSSGREVRVTVQGSARWNAS